MLPYSLPDITGDGATHALDVPSVVRAKWVQVLADSGNSGVVRIGGPDVTDSVGLPLEKGKSIFYPQDHADQTSFYPLSSLHYNAANGDVLYVQYGAG